MPVSLSLSTYSLGNKSFDFSLQFIYRKWFDYIVVASYTDAALKLKSTV